MHAILWIVFRCLLSEFCKNESGGWCTFSSADFPKVLIEGFQSPVREEIGRCGTEDEIRCFDCRFCNDGLAGWRIDQHVAIGAREVRQDSFDDILEPSLSRGSKRL